MQDHKSLCAAVAICSTLVNIQTHTLSITLTHTGSTWPAYLISSASWAKNLDTHIMLHHSHSLPPLNIFAKPHQNSSLPTSGHLTVWPEASRLQNLRLASGPDVSELCIWCRWVERASGWEVEVWRQTSGRRSVTRLSLSRESDFRPISTWRDITSNICCEPKVNLKDKIKQCQVFEIKFC